MTEARRSGTIGCGKVVGYGCLGIVLLILVGALAIWASWDLLRQSGVGRGLAETVGAVRGQIEAIDALRDSLSADYPAEDLGADIQIVTRDGVTTKTLRLSFLNPRFELPEAAEARRLRAHEIARATAERFPDLRRYGILRIEIRTRSADGASSSSTTHEFPTGEL